MRVCGGYPALGVLAVTVEARSNRTAGVGIAAEMAEAFAASKGVAVKDFRERHLPQKRKGCGAHRQTD
jgi:hypothetical protein